MKIRTDEKSNGNKLNCWCISRGMRERTEYFMNGFYFLNPRKSFCVVYQMFFFFFLNQRTKLLT